MTDSPRAPRKGPVRVKADAPDPIDVHVGQRVRKRRMEMGMSQEKLGLALGLTFQQVQKYERGANRIGASRLFDLSRVLEVQIAYFFEEMPETALGPTSRARRGLSASTSTAYEPDPMAKRETMDLVRAYYRIPDNGVRKRLFELTKSLAIADQTSPI
ncbi:MAG: helix-turn-helix transcriptional regulator [Alphaproteobacteria bacterium]|nr:helix-turn-helix transcriptional regulator [Alphaproteobacteria bacterium]